MHSVCVFLCLLGTLQEMLRHLLDPPVDSLVSMRRQLATLLMATHALLELPRGDLVEAGVYRGGTAVLMADRSNSQLPRNAKPAAQLGATPPES